MSGVLDAERFTKYNLFVNLYNSLDFKQGSIYFFIQSAFII